VKIAILDDYQNVALELADWNSLPEECEVEVFTEHFTGSNVVKERLRDFEVIVAMRERTPFCRGILAGLPGLKLLITTGMRNASIDLAAANELGILVCGTGGRGFATAELAWGLILALTRHIPLEDSVTRRGQWQTTIGTELMNKTLGIVGLGNLGSRMAIIAISMITVLTSAVVTMFALVCFDMMPINAQTITRP